MTRLNRRALLLAGLAAVVLVLSYGPLLVPGQALAARDIPFLHLPLRGEFRALAAHGLPRWNPLLHGGDAILSNPHYSAFYPATWLLLPLEPTNAIRWLILLHAVLALFGAYRLLRRLGCRGVAAGFGAVAYAGGGTFVGLAGTLLMFTGMAWLPWLLAWGEDLLALPADASAHERVLATGRLALGFGLQMLNGDPAAVLTTGALLLLRALLGDRAAEGAVRRRQALLRLGQATALALLLAAVQVVPTAARLSESVRGGGLGAAQAASWSTHPARLVDMVFPRFFGDPSRDEEGLYFGWDLNDKQYPFLISIAPGLPVLVLALAALMGAGIPHRRVWASALGLGLLLGVGRFDPLWPALRAVVPGLSMVRYPEKFLLLATTCLAIAGAFGLERLLAERETGAGTTRRRALVVLSAIAAAGLGVALWLGLAQSSAEAFVRRHAGGPISPGGIVAGLAYLRREAWIAFALALAVGLWLGLLGSRRARSAAVLGGLGILLLLAEQVHEGRGLLPVLPRAELLAAPRLVQQLEADLGPGERVATDIPFTTGSAFGLRVGRLGFYQMRGRLERLEPYSGNLWGLPYALHEDFDLMLGGWGRLALANLHQTWEEPAAARRYLAAWGVGALVRLRSASELVAEIRAGEKAPQPARFEPIAALPLLRTVGRATFHPDAAAAVAAARAAGWNVGEVERCIAPERAAAEPLVEYAAGAVVVASDPERPDRRRITVDSPGTALVVWATTYDSGWTARADGAPLVLWPTAAGEMAFEVPAGRHQVELSYRDPWVAVGGAASAVAALGLLLAALRTRERHASHRSLA